MFWGIIEEMRRLVDAPACVVIPNWNGADCLGACLDSLRQQTLKPHVIVVDNGSVDGSLALIKEQYPEVELIEHSYNKGFAGGVNPGFQRAIDLGLKYVAALNNDAVVDPAWLQQLVTYLDHHDRYGIATCKLLTEDGKRLDSTGEGYTTWGLAYPRGRHEQQLDSYDNQIEIFAASGGASLYRVKTLEEVGLFDEDFFAYYEDVDLSFRAQLAGWKIAYAPAAVAYHQIGTTSSKIKDFAVYQTMKNLPLLLAKNLPQRYLWRVGWRFMLARVLFFGRAVSRGQGWAALKGDARGTYLLFGASAKRRHIQATKKVSDEYIWSIMTHDLPPNAHALRRLRTKWRHLVGRAA
jgi:GT2 family glycosyltransferase